MYLILLFVLQVYSEWVEISQQHYKKPLRPVYTHTLEKPDLEMTTKGNRIYINHSLPDYDWSGAVIQKPSDVRRHPFETFNEKAVMARPEITEPARVIKIEDFDTKQQYILELPKSVAVQSDKNSNFLTSDTSKAIISQHVTPKPFSKKSYDINHFEIKPLEIYNLTDLDLFFDDYTTTPVIQKKINVETTTAETKPHTTTQHTVITKPPRKEIIAQDYFDDDWPINEDRYEYVVQIVPSKTNTRRVEIIRNTVKPPVLKSTKASLLESYKPSTTPIPLQSNLRTNNGIFSTDQGLTQTTSTLSTTNTERTKDRQTPTTTTNRFLYEVESATSYNGNNKVNKATHSISELKSTSTTIRPDTEADGANFDGDIPDRNEPKPISIKKNSIPETKGVRNSIQNNSLPTTNPDKVMLHEILKNEEVSTETTFKKVSQSNTGVIKRMYPTKIVKVDKNGHEIEVVSKNLTPTKATHYVKEEVTNAKNMQQKQNVVLHHLNNIIDSNENENIQNPMPTQRTHYTEETIHVIEKSTEKTHILSTAATKYDTNVFNRDSEGHDYGSFESFVHLKDKIPNFVTKDNNFSRDQEFSYTKVDDNRKIQTDMQKIKDTNIEDAGKKYKKVEHETVSDQNKDDLNNVHDDLQDKKGEILTNENKTSTMETLMKVLKIVTDTIKRNTRRNFNSKVRYLEDLRDTISRSIEDRIEAIFPDDEVLQPSSGSRKTRSAHAQPRGHHHVEFPSSESALMTISFLTFAVYLIKLVLQIIHAYKNNAMMVMPTVVAAVGRAYDRNKN